MDFRLSEEQELLLKTGRDFLTANCPKSLVREMSRDEAGHPVGLWQKMAETGWMGLIIPEEYGGAGAGFSDLTVLLEEIGRACLPGPFFATVVLGGLTVLEAGSEEQKRQLLPRLAEGQLLLTLAMAESGAGYTADCIQNRAAGSGGEYLLRGTKLFVPYAHISDYMICAARTRDSGTENDGITLFLVDSKSPGLSCAALRTIAGDKLCEVIFDNVKVSKNNILGNLNGGWPVLEKVLEKAVIGQCAEMVGCIKQVLEMTVEYAKQRTAFGRPIGSFQAIQHYCANMLVDVDGCSLMVNNAAWRLSEGLPATQEVSMAKALLNEKLKHAVTRSIQIHGAIGITEDHDLSVYFKQAKAWEVSLGDTRFHLDKIAQAVKI
jgi:alkylation response protein AidB-like acyl-CoA dehydrogenase